MSINLIAAVILNKGKLCIGYNNDLICRIPGDLKNFKKLTENNIVVMGRKTWESLNCKPLKNRINIVLSREKHEHYTTFEKFKSSYPLESGKKYFIIGGAEIYNLFLKDPVFYPQKLYLTHIKYKMGDKIPDTWISDEHLSKYKIDSFSPEKEYNDVKYRYLEYSRSETDHEENQYLNLMKNILENGNARQDRTGTGTLSLFGTSMRFDISKSIPMMTTRSTPFRIILEELLFFCRGDTDAKILQGKNVKIWDGNTSREFLDKRGLHNYKEGVMGPIYGFQWRFFGADYDQSYANVKDAKKDIGGTDQLKNVENLLKNDPFSRRIVISAWNPNYTDKMVLAPCHILLQFYVEEIDGKKHLSCQFYQRSSDQLAFCFNVVSYSVLTHILAKKCDMIPKDIIYVAGDCHIYKNHLDSVKQQITRNIRPFPLLEVKEEVKHKKWDEICVDDFDLIGYMPHPAIKMKMSV